MILEYNYDKGNIVLEHFKKSELATLEIKTLIKENLTDNLSLETIFKGIETSYYYETDEY